jgi:hypothetical protein
VSRASRWRDPNGVASTVPTCRASDHAVSGRPAAQAAMTAISGAPTGAGRLLAARPATAASWRATGRRMGEGMAAMSVVLPSRREVQRRREKSKGLRIPWASALTIFCDGPRAVGATPGRTVGAGVCAGRSLAIRPDGTTGEEANP